MTLAEKLNEMGTELALGEGLFTSNSSFNLTAAALASQGIITQEEASFNSYPHDWTDQTVMGALEAILRFINQAEDAVNTEEARAAGQRLSSVSVQEGTSIQSDGTGSYRTVTYTVRFRQPVDMQPVGPVLG